MCWFVHNPASCSAAGLDSRKIGSIAKPKIRRCAERILIAVASGYPEMHVAVVRLFGEHTAPNDWSSGGWARGWGGVQRR